MINNNKIKFKKKYKNNDDMLSGNILARYRTFDEEGKNINNLKEDKLYYSTPTYFNDIFDSKLYVNNDKIKDTVKNIIKINMGTYLNFLQQDNELLYYNVEAMLNGGDKNKLLESFLEYISNLAINIKNRINKNVKILCFSKGYLSPLMWAHYADDNKGFAIIYDVNSIINGKNYTLEGNLINKKISLEKVSYVEQQTDFSFEIMEYLKNNAYKAIYDFEKLQNYISINKLKNVLLEKQYKWEYEEEWRVIPRFIDLKKESNLGYMELLPKAIIVGNKCTKDNLKKIKKICNEKNIPCDKIITDNQEPTFKLSIKEL